MSKWCQASEALAEVDDGAVIAVGGFGPAGVPIMLTDALLESGAERLHLVTNNVGDGWGLGRLVDAGRVARLTMTYMGQNKRLAESWLAGDLEIEFVPQGTLAERLRAAGAGIAAFYTPTGAGTLVADGGMPLRFSAGEVVKRAEPKEQRAFGGRSYVLETALACDVALVHAQAADSCGNLRFRAAARNFNPVMATAARLVVAEAERILEVGSLAPDDVHLPGAYVDRLVGPVPPNARVDIMMTREVS